LLLAGGGLSQLSGGKSLRWVRAHVAGPANVRGGNLLILKASGGRDYSEQFYQLARFASVREILIPPCASRAQVDSVAAAVNAADFVLFAGGDQANYAAWKGSRLVQAVRDVYARGGIAGGGSAGLAIQGQVVFDSVAADRVLADGSVKTADAVRNPYEPAISFTTGFFEWPPLRDAITDTHFARRDRFGRLTAFMARSLQDGLVAGPAIYGVAVDEGATLLVDSHGIATLVQPSRKPDGYAPQGAYILRGVKTPVMHGKPLRYTVRVTHIARSGETYDLLHKRGSGASYTVTVNGAASHIYSRNPYSDSTP
jgi:cyanophycinase-like exopeptidase